VLSPPGHSSPAAGRYPRESIDSPSRLSRPFEGNEEKHHSPRPSHASSHTMVSGSTCGLSSLAVTERYPSAAADGASTTGWDFYHDSFHDPALPPFMTRAMWDGHQGIDAVPHTFDEAPSQGDDLKYIGSDSVSGNVNTSCGALQGRLDSNVTADSVMADSEAVPADVSFDDPTYDTATMCDDDKADLEEGGLASGIVAGTGEKLRLGNRLSVYKFPRIYEGRHNLLGVANTTSASAASDIGYGEEPTYDMASASFCADPVHTSRRPTMDGGSGSPDFAAARDLDLDDEALGYLASGHFDVSASPAGTLTARSISDHNPDGLSGTTSFSPYARSQRLFAQRNTFASTATLSSLSSGTLASHTSVDDVSMQPLKLHAFDARQSGNDRKHSTTHG